MSSLVTAIRCLLMSAVLVLALGALPVAASSSCTPANDPREAQLDQDGIAQARAGGLSLNVTRRCAGFSVAVEDGIDDAIAAEYASDAEQAYAHLAAETGNTLSPRAVLFVFREQDTMATGEHVVGGIASATREPRAGYAWLNTIWLDNSRHPTASARAQAVAHEFSHLFAAVTAKGKTIPAWFDEGLAVDSEITIPAEAYPAASRALQNDQRFTVLGAVSGDGPLDLFPLDELKTRKLWQQHYRDPEEQDLEYAQAYETLRAAVGSRGRAAAWNVLRKMGEGMDFDVGFEAAIGTSVQNADDMARASWAAELVTAPEPLALDIQIASGDAELEVTAWFEKETSRISGPVAAGTSVHVQLGSEDAVSFSGADLNQHTTVFDEDEGDRYVTGLSVRIRRDDGTSELVHLTRSFGRWEAGTRYLVAPAADGLFTTLSGPLSDPFPSGDRIVSSKES